MPRSVSIHKIWGKISGWPMGLPEFKTNSLKAKLSATHSSGDLASPSPETISAPAYVTTLLAKSRLRSLV